MEQDWDFYLLRADDQPASTYVDLALARIAPVADQPVMTYVSVTMRTPRPDGLSSNEEFDALIAIEDELAGALQAGGAAIYAGRCTTSGNRDFYFYTDAPSACADRAAEVMADHAAYQYVLGHRPDPAWTVYFDFLYPGPQDLQRIFNRRVVALLQENGDEISQPRWIDHRAYLPGRAAAETLLADLSTQGFSIVTDPEDSAERIAVDFKRIDQPDAIDAVVLPLVTMITALGGSYDGWGCEVETGRG